MKKGGFASLASKANVFIKHKADFIRAKPVFILRAIGALSFSSKTIPK